MLLWAALTACLVFAEAYFLSEPPVRRGDLESVQNWLVRQLTGSTAKRQLGSASLVLLNGGQLASEHGFGITNSTTHAPTDPGRTLYVVASVSKAVTAWGVMKLVQDGRLDLDEPVSRRLRRWQFPGSEPSLAARVTTRHLLSHTAGLDDGLGYGGFLPGQSVQTLEQSLTLARDSSVGEPRPARVATEPGAALAYSGASYSILQLLIEEITGQAFTDYMTESVLRPLGMTRASFDLDAIGAAGREDDLATPWDRDITPGPHRRYTALAAVSLRATARDLAQFARAYHGINPVLTDATLRQMLTAQPGTGGSWGLGQTIFLSTSSGTQIVGHDGGTLPAFGATVRVNPATGNGIVLAVSGGRAPVSQLANGWVFWETGQVLPAAKRQMVQDRLVPALAAIAAGGLIIVWWRSHRRSPLRL